MLTKYSKLSNLLVTAASQCNINAQRLISSQTLAQLPRAQYGGRHTVALLPGDGTGPELMNHLKTVFRCAGVPVDFEEVPFDHTISEQQYENALLAIKRNGVAIKGNVETAYREVASKSRNLALRTELDLFANVVWCKSIPGVATRHKNVDLVIIRENTEGEYRQLEHETSPGVVESLKIITAKNSLRIAKYAFDFAKRNNRKKVTVIHKANIMKLADGLFLESCRSMSRLYPDIAFSDMIIDNCSMQMVSKPQQFDVLVLPNLYGNIVANIGCGLVGGPGMLPGVNVGDHLAVFESATRNTGKNIAGKNVVNPSSMILAGAEMLEHLGLKQQGALVKEAVSKVFNEGKIRTPDLGGTSTTSEVVNAIAKYIESQVK